MDKVERYRAAVRAVVAEFGRWKSLSPQVATLVINDDTSGNYLAIMAGWEDAMPIYQPLVHLQLRGEQVVVIWHTTDVELDRLLLDADVAYRDIVMGETDVEQPAPTTP